MTAAANRGKTGAGQRSLKHGALQITSNGRGEAGTRPLASSCHIPC
jgi:hypothetical protein